MDAELPAAAETSGRYERQGGVSCWPASTIAMPPAPLSVPESAVPLSVPESTLPPAPLSVPPPSALPPAPPVPVLVSLPASAELPPAPLGLPELLPQAAAIRVSPDARTTTRNDEVSRLGRMLLLFIGNRR